MKVSEIFVEAGLSPRGPVRWRVQVPEPNEGIYMVARVCDPDVGCETSALPFINPLHTDPDVPPVVDRFMVGGNTIEVDIEFERQRWLSNEPIVYIGKTEVGKTDRTIQKRVGEYYRHKCVDNSPHAGGQIVHLLKCNLWVYWSPSPNPYDAEQTMLCAFRKQVGKLPFANFDGRRRSKRIRLLKEPESSR